MNPTPRALKLLPQIQAALNQLENAINENIKFKPSETKQNFTIAMIENAAFILLPLLTPYLFKNATNIKIDIIGVNNIKGTQLIETERCDMALDLSPKTFSRPLKKVPLYKEKFVCITRRGLPILSLEPTLENYLLFTHISEHSNEGSDSSVDTALKSIRKRRHIAIKSPYSLLLNLMLDDSDLVATLPKRNALFFRIEKI